MLGEGMRRGSNADGNQFFISMSSQCDAIAAARLMEMMCSYN